MDETITTPLVSVILPVYNAAMHLKEAIDSILTQTYTNFEFLILNDGSTDNSAAIIDSYTDKRIRKINNPTNQGLIFTLNKGMAESQGKYIARMDADDISLPERFEKQVDFLEKHGEVGICSCDYFQFNDNKKWLSKSFSNHDEVLTHLLFNCSIAHPTLMLRKSVLQKQSLLYDSNYPHAEDYELWSRLVFKCSISSVNENLFMYRVHSNQITSKYHAEQIESGNKIRRNILDKCGFVFTENELRLHCLLGSSTLITTKKDLADLGEWLNKLVVQNHARKLITNTLFNRIIARYWYDACGNPKLVFPH